MDRRHTSTEIETSVFLKSARRCALCFWLSRDLREKSGQIAHLNRDPSNCSEDNLAFMCLPHHSQYDSKTSQHKNYTIQEVKAARARLYEAIAEGKHAASDSPPPFIEADSQRKLRMILPLKGKIVKHTLMNTGKAAFLLGREGGSSYVEVLDCNDSFVKIGKTGSDAWSRSIALADIEIGHDDTRDCLQLQVTNG